METDRFGTILHHSFTADLLGTCTECSMPEDHPSHRDRQADQAAGRAAGEEGADLALHARAMALWRVTAEAVLDQLIDGGRPFTSDDLTDAAGEPPHPNGMGGLFSAASKAGRIQAVGYTQATRVSAHARVIRVWQAVNS